MKKLHSTDEFSAKEAVLLIAGKDYLGNKLAVPRMRRSVYLRKPSGSWTFGLPESFKKRYGRGGSGEFALTELTDGKTLKECMRDDPSIQTVIEQAEEVLDYFTDRISNAETEAELERIDEEINRCKTMDFYSQFMELRAERGEAEPAART